MLYKMEFWKSAQGYVGSCGFGECYRRIVSCDIGGKRKAVKTPSSRRGKMKRDNDDD